MEDGINDAIAATTALAPVATATTPAPIMPENKALELLQAMVPFLPQDLSELGAPRAARLLLEVTQAIRHVEVQEPIASTAAAAAAAPGGAGGGMPAAPAPR